MSERAVTKRLRLPRERATARAPHEPAVRRRARPLVAAALSAVVPGAGQALSGRRARAAMLVAPVIALGAVGYAVARRGAGHLVALAVQPRWLWTLIAVNAGLAALRLFAVIDAYRAARRAAAPPRRRWPAPIVVTLLLVATAAPHAVVAAYAVETLDLLESVFVGDQPEGELAAQPAAATPPILAAEAVPDPALIPPAPPPIVPDTTAPRVTFVAPPLSDARELIPAGDLNAERRTFEPTAPDAFGAPFLPLEKNLGQERLTILLAGGDAGPGRGGLRTDTMIVATLDVSSGRAALFGIPRNLARVPVPPGFDGAFIGLERELHDQWVARLRPAAPPADQAEGAPPPAFSPPAFRHCHCFPDAINALYPATQGWTASFPGAVDPGMEMLSRTLGNLLGLPIDYYVLVDMAGFVALIDALGGVDVNVPTAVHDRVSPAVAGEEWITIDIAPGQHHLSGRETLAYVRARTDSSDYARMQRQRCLVRAVVAEVDPISVLTSYPAIADAIRSATTTNIPLRLLPDLVRLTSEVSLSDVVTTAFEPPYFSRGGDFRGMPMPHVDRIQAHVQEVLASGAATGPGGGDSCG